VGAGTVLAIIEVAGFAAAAGAVAGVWAYACAVNAELIANTIISFFT
jgi:hypothetical protein